MGKKADLFLISHICDSTLEPNTSKPSILQATTKLSETYSCMGARLFCSDKAPRLAATSSSTVVSHRFTHLQIV